MLREIKFLVRYFVKFKFKLDFFKTAEIHEEFLLTMNQNVKNV